MMVHGAATTAESPSPLLPHECIVKVGIGVCVLVIECTISVVGSDLYSRSAFYLFVTQMLAVALGTLSLLGRATCTPPASWSPVDEPLNSTGCFNWFDDKAAPNPLSPGGSYQYFAYGPSTATLRHNLWPAFDEGVTFQKVHYVLCASRLCQALCFAWHVFSRSQPFSQWPHDRRCSGLSFPP